MQKYYVTMTDKFMSGWGLAKNKINKMVVICESFEQAATIAKNARKRSEMRFVNICYTKPSYPQHSYLTSWKQFSDLSGPWLET